ncbi:MAG: ASCH domain-containing protein [Myxococcales bacterium]|nr:ASCH domain-containing protein [Myxococcales bacterium]
MLVLILDPTHAVLLDGDRLPDVPLTGGRPMHTVETAFATRGLALPAPAGSRARADGGRDFAFLIDRVDAPAGMTWRPLREVATDDTLWQLYVELVLGGYAPPTRALDVWYFGNTPEMAAKLVHLVACGAKRVTMGWVAAAERDGTPLAHEGGVSIVTDGFGYPRVCVRSAEVRVMRFDEVTAADAAGEGEGDLSYEDWRCGHTAYFSREGEKLGLAFDDSAQISIERFEVLHVIGRRDVPDAT